MQWRRRLPPERLTRFIDLETGLSEVLQHPVGEQAVDEAIARIKEILSE